MRVVAYVRESLDPAADRSAFAQQEEIRRDAAARGLQVVAICQDLRLPGRPLGRDGYLSLLGVLASGHAEGVLLPGVETLSSDLVIQEILLWDLRARGIRVLSSDPADLDILGGPNPADPTRQFVRDVLARVAEHASALASASAPPPPEPAAAQAETLIVTLVSPEDASTGRAG